MKTLIMRNDVHFYLPSLAVASKTLYRLPDVTVDTEHVTWFDMHREETFIINENLVSRSQQLLPTPSGIRLYYPTLFSEYSESFYVHRPLSFEGLAALLKAVSFPMSEYFEDGKYGIQQFLQKHLIMPSYTFNVYPPINLQLLRTLYDQAVFTEQTLDSFRFTVSSAERALFEDLLPKSVEFYYMRTDDLITSDEPFFATALQRLLTALHPFKTFNGLTAKDRSHLAFQLHAHFF